tara:strand:+ start:850 stop:1263 length:414 start_codon:yes stop_codon:yes gene_type:complete
MEHTNHCDHSDMKYAGTSKYTLSSPERDIKADYYFWLAQEDGCYDWRICVRFSSEPSNHLSGSIDMYYNDSDVMRMFATFMCRKLGDSKRRDKEEHDHLRDVIGSLMIAQFKGESKQDQYRSVINAIFEEKEVSEGA